LRSGICKVSAVLELVIRPPAPCVFSPNRGTLTSWFYVHGRGRSF